MPGVPCGDRGKWDQESVHDRSHACSAKKAYERLNLELFRNVSVHEFYLLKALIALEQVNTTEWSEKKKKKNLNLNLMLISKIAMVGCGKLSRYANEVL